MEDKIIKEIETICQEHMSRTVFIKKLRRLFCSQYSEFSIEASFLIIKFHNKLEDIFDRILRNYIRPRQKDEDLYNDDIMKALKLRNDPEKVRHDIIFNLDFIAKKNILHKMFGLPKKTREFIEKLNNMRNGIAHRYAEEDQRFLYHKKSIFSDKSALEQFVVEYGQVVNDILSLDTNLLDAIDKTEEKYG